MTAAPPLSGIVGQHVDEAVHLRNVRSVLVRAPHVRLQQLARFDDRLAAHLEGIALAGDCGARLTREALAPPGAGAIFVGTVRAIESRDAAQLDRLRAIARAEPTGRRGLVSAFGWTSASHLRGITKTLLDSDVPDAIDLGLAACAMHGVDPGEPLAHALDRADATLRLRAICTAVAVGRTDLRARCMAAGNDLPPREVARATALLGDHRVARQALQQPDAGLEPPDLELGLKVMPADEARSLIRRLHADDPQQRRVLGAVGVAGDAHYVPWLMERMEDPKLARLAGEAFTLITGAQLDLLGLDRPSAPSMPDGDDLVDGAVAIADDDGLPWPDAARVATWWKENGSRLPPGTRCFMGHPPTAQSCLSVLRNGSQRQRRHAAQYLCLLNPGTPLFNIAAPAWRQQRLLTQMSGS